MPESESPEQFRARMRSISVISGGRTRPLEKTIVRPSVDPSGNQLDAGKKAKVTINEDRDIVITTSDNRQDANVFGNQASVSGEGVH